MAIPCIGPPLASWIIDHNLNRWILIARTSLKFYLKLNLTFNFSQHPNETSLGTLHFCTKPSILVFSHSPLYGTRFSNNRSPNGSAGIQMVSIYGHQSTARLRAFMWMEASDGWGLQEHSQIRTVCKGVAGFVTGNSSCVLAMHWPVAYVHDLFTTGFRQLNIMET